MRVWRGCKIFVKSEPSLFRHGERQTNRQHSACPLPYRAHVPAGAPQGCSPALAPGASVAKGGNRPAEKNRHHLYYFNRDVQLAGQAGGGSVCRSRCKRLVRSDARLRRSRNRESRRRDSGDIHDIIPRRSTKSRRRFESLDRWRVLFRPGPVHGDCGSLPIIQRR